MYTVGKSNSSSVVPVPPLSDFLLNGSACIEIDPKILDDFNKKTFDTSTEISSFDGFSSVSGSDKSETGKYNMNVDSL